jgi:hypothetical protein
MNKIAEVVALVEGPTEQAFIRDIIAPHLAASNVFMTPIILSKPGEKGGDVRFARAQNDIGLHLKQRYDTYLTMFIDFYGVRGDWPGLDQARRQTTAAGKAKKLNEATMQKVLELFSDQRPDKRFIPHVAVHEFEALLFSDPEILSTQLQVSKSQIERVLAECGTPEEIDDSPQTAPSKRLEDLAKRFKKTTTGITIAKSIGLNRMREKCPIFAAWLKQMENLKGLRHA